MKNHKWLLSILFLAVSSLLLNACSFSFEVLATPTSTRFVDKIEPPQAAVAVISIDVDPSKIPLTGHS